MQYALPKWLAEFRQTYPDVTMEIAVTADYVDLSKRDVDVVIRATSSPPEHLVGRNTGPWGLAAYACSKRYLDRVGRNRPLADYEWLQYDVPVRRSPLAKWIDQNVDDASIKLWFDAFTTLLSALNADLGCSALPCYTGDNDPELEQLPGTHAMSGSSLWVLTHPETAASRADPRLHGVLLDALGDDERGADDLKRPPRLPDRELQGENARDASSGLRASPFRNAVTNQPLWGERGRCLPGW